MSVVLLLIFVGFGFIGVCCRLIVGLLFDLRFAIELWAYCFVCLFAFWVLLFVYCVTIAFFVNSFIDVFSYYFCVVTITFTCLMV